MNRTVYIQPQHNDDFWTHDAPLFVGTFPYYRNEPRPVRGKIHVSDEQYVDVNREIVPIANPRRGNRTYVMMQPYVLEPQLFMTVGLYPKPNHYADQDDAIGKVLSTQVKS